MRLRRSNASRHEIRRRRSPLSFLFVLVAAVVAIRSYPDLVRYVRMKRM